MSATATLTTMKQALLVELCLHTIVAASMSATAPLTTMKHAIMVELCMHGIVASMSATATLTATKQTVVKLAMEELCTDILVV